VTSVHRFRVADIGASG